MQIEVTDSDDKAIRLAIQAVPGEYNTEKLGQPSERHALAVLLRAWWCVTQMAPCSVA